jgi:hypothetical protein
MLIMRRVYTMLGFGKAISIPKTRVPTVVEMSQHDIGTASLSRLFPIFSLL